MYVGRIRWLGTKSTSVSQFRRSVAPDLEETYLHTPLSIGGSPFRIPRSFRRRRRNWSCHLRPERASACGRWPLREAISRHALIQLDESDMDPTTKLLF